MNVKKKNPHARDLVLLPLGGTGEIGMNCYCYGAGSNDDREWLMVDLGVKFGEESDPGIDVVLPDVSFIAKNRKKLAGRFPPRVRARELWRVAPEFLDQAQDDATLLAIRDQERAGLDIITDGEMRRLSFQSRLVEAVEGFGEWDVDAFLWGEWKSDALGPLRIERPPLAVVAGCGVAALAAGAIRLRRWA